MRKKTKAGLMAVRKVKALKSGGAKKYRSGSALDRRKEWTRDTAARFVEFDSKDIAIDEAARGAQAFRAVDLASKIWELVEGRFVDGVDERKKYDG